MSLYAKLGRTDAPIVVDDARVCKDITAIVRKECPISDVQRGGTILNLGSGEMSVNYLCACRGKEFVACVEYALIPTEDTGGNLPVINSLSVRQADKPCFGVSGYKRFERYARRRGLEVEFSGYEE